MDAQAKKKAFYRSKLNAQKLGNRIESPLVRYNEHDQPVCRVCDVVLKSESLWPAHQASRKHHEAINNVKANAASLARANNVKPDPSSELPKPKPESSTGLPKPRPSSVLPSDFFDNQETKRQKSGPSAADSHKNVRASVQTQMMGPVDSEGKLDEISSPNVIETKAYEIQAARENTQASTIIDGSESKQIKGALPEGFFDDKDADLRARGITPVKPDIKDEYKEFEKLIQEDLKEVDNRMEEEEFDAAETIEEAESAEQMGYRERVEMLRRKKMELKAARSAANPRGSQAMGKDSGHEESSNDDDDSDENFTVDWRAKHL